MLIDIVVLLGSLILILASCAVFINGIECFGYKLKLHQGIVGSIFAAIGTALPETIIPILAIAFSKNSATHAIGIGAIAGAPFMLATLALFVTGSAVVIFTLLGKRTLAMNVHSSILSKDLLFFLIIYGAAIAATSVHHIIWLKSLIAICIFLSYFLYLKLIVDDKAEKMDRVDVLYFHEYIRFPDNLFTASAQVLATLLLIILGAHLFIAHVQSLAVAINISPLILSLIITPIATEMPEKFNSVIWVSRDKDTLALGNITGAMVFQSCIPVVFGMIYTEWDLHGIILVSAILALTSASIMYIWVRLRRNINPFILMVGGILYGLFLLTVFGVIHLGLD